MGPNFSLSAAAILPLVARATAKLPANRAKTRRDGARRVLLVAGAALAMVTMSAHPAYAEDTPNIEGVYPGSGFRLPLPQREKLDAEGQAIFDRMAAASKDPRRGAAGPGPGLRGPSGIMLYSPKYFDIANKLNLYLRFESGLDDFTRELAILVVAREADSAYEWTAHQTPARAAGVEDSVIEGVRCGFRSAALSERAAVIVALGRETITNHHLSRQTYDRAFQLFGAKSLVDLTGLMGAYLSTAVTLSAFAMQLPEARPNARPSLDDACKR